MKYDNNKQDTHEDRCLTHNSTDLDMGNYYLYYYYYFYYYYCYYYYYY